MDESVVKRDYLLTNQPCSVKSRCSSSTTLVNQRLADRFDIWLDRWGEAGPRCIEVNDASTVPLPPGWEQRFDRAVRRIVFINHNSQRAHHLLAGRTLAPRSCMAAGLEAPLEPSTAPLACLSAARNLVCAVAQSRRMLSGYLLTPKEAPRAR